MRLNVNVEYTNLEEYQTALLNIVDLPEYNDLIVERLQCIMDEMKNVEQVTTAVRRLKSSSGMDEAWLLLFSYENLKITYEAWSEWRQTGRCPELRIN